MTPLHVDNRTARRLLLDVTGLAPGSTGTPKDHRLDAAAAIVDALGMVQLDPIRPVVRAHEHILWSRDHRVRPPAFERLIEERRVFEHFSHDAVILPMALWPFWQRQRVRRAKALERGSWGQALPRAAERRAILARIAREGPLCSRDFERVPGRTGTWSRPPHKVALDWLWLGGALAVSHRRGFVKHYDLAERVIPAAVARDTRDDAAQLERLHRDALARLGLASAGELQRFWEATTTAETRAWIAARPTASIDVSVEMADGRRLPMIAAPDIEDRIVALPEPGTRVRVVNPFDPLVRDRTRLARLFGFDFRLEIYVPPAKRRYGYYVYPLLEGTRFVGRAEVRANRDENRLDVLAWWLEPGVRGGSGRLARLEAELKRLARLAGVTGVGELPTPRHAP